MAQRGLRAAADLLIELAPGEIVLVRRANPPLGWAIPGGFIETGETAEQAAAREAFEETGLEVELLELFNVYSDPRRDPRHHTLSVVFIGRAEGDGLAAGDDAAEARAFSEATLPAEIAFDHRQVLADYFRYRRTGERPPPRPERRHLLSKTERQLLLDIAGQTIRAAIENRPLAPFTAVTGALLEPAGAFVSLHKDGELRGCIGTFARDRPLHAIVGDMALAAAFEDPRFPPVAASELSSLEIEISVLSDLRRTEPESVVPGFHGVSVARGGMKGVFLPKVATEAGWDRTTLLEQTCLKAGLPPHAWQDPAAEISVFTAEVFGEKR